jgi:tripartite-type tricarboxylate transporter receptor subunit TctC
MKRREFIRFVGAAAACAWPFAAPRAQERDSVAAFYRGKTLRIMGGSQEGGGYDLTARIIANRIGSHIPGNPSVIVENNPAASGLAMTNSLYNIAPRDGTTIGLPPNAIALD